MKYRKPESCPQCGTRDIRFIIRGMPSEEGIRMLLDKKAVPGSFIAFADLPMWRCGECGHELSDETDPMVIRKRRFESRWLSAPC